MHALLATVGTGGDVFPYIGLGERLRSRGHRVTLAGPAEFRALAEGRGLAYHALVSEEESNALLNDPDFWHPLKGGRVAARWGARLIGRQYTLLAGLAADTDAVLVASPGVFAARLVQEKMARPMATVLLQPGLIPSRVAPPVMPGGLTLPRRAPRWAGRLYWRLFDAVGGWLVGSHLTPLRASLGLKRVRRLFQWWLSPQRVIGLFPEWYGPPQSDWPSQIRLTGFPLYDGTPNRDLPADVAEFCRAGPPPVAFTFGTGMRHAAGPFRAAAEACRLLGALGLLLTRHAEQLPHDLPASVRCCDFAPFGELFPQCAAVVHHGGVGTVARALAAGTPQLILPWAYDQEDNAARVKRLGAGERLGPHQRSASQIAKALNRLMSAEMRARCRAVAEWFDDKDGLEGAVRCVEELAEGTRI